MHILVLTSVVLGLILGKFFKFPILIPVYVVAIVSVLISSRLLQISVIDVLLELLVFIMSIQVGYFTGVFARQIQIFLLPSSSNATSEHSGGGLGSSE